MNDMSHSFSINTNMNSNEQYIFAQMRLNKSEQYLQYMNETKQYLRYTNESKQYFIVHIFKI